ncbi:MAG: Lrp/AsnC ligand binding domain-containing protein [Theionarchaea archaeon]|nr:Lrp/AsnC ligand binding domain-containing protein [Theionarchaea archaeon]
MLALVEIRTENVPLAKERLMEIPYVLAFYELMSRFNIAVIVELDNKQALFEFLTLKVRTIPDVKETKTHIIQNGIVI